ncbi:peptidoglycan-binding protein [Kutzneria sp. CA-103260]|uniref:peptidoglycan-binding protein n=1 Tax=Kutzneria sp. CA-103260 TaxID=2802641 RepID=UPI001BA8C178|nr:peptidoglycan-binding protein [Kutzneria sp. CA-103260]QUQ67548.1 peptidoglycan-binding protein [Kutzneria sp. CA-103260]
MTRSEQKRRGRRTRWLVGATVLVVVLGTGSVVVLAQASEAGTPPTPPPPVATATVTKTDLSEQESADGTLGYGAESDVTGRKPGTITWLPPVGSAVNRGQQVYGVDAAPVVLFYGILPFYRDLSAGVADGPDVKELEENLAALGYTGFGTPDTKFTAATAAALKRWQKAQGLPQTGTFSPGDVVLAAGPVRVSTVTAQLGGAAQGPVVKTTGTSRVVQVKLDVAKQDLAKVGDKVSVDVNGGSSTGRVVDVGHNAVPDKDSSGQPNGRSVITVTVTLDDPNAGGGLDSAPVTVHFVKDVHKDVLVVPVGALLALREGGYALEVEQNGQRHLVPVQTGLFSGGQVEVSGAGLSAGTKVVTTS